MSKFSFLVISTVLLGSIGCGSPAPDKQAKAAPKADTPKADTPKADPPKVEPPKADPPKVEPAPELVEPTTAMPPEGVEPAPTEPAPTEPAEPPAEPPAGGWKAPAGVDIRSDAAIPPGTPAANAEAFKALPQTKVDGPPVSGIASNGLHFDSMVLGRGWEKSKCLEATSTFTVGTDDRVNICVRVVHPADADETLLVEWSKAGTKTVRKSNISVKAMHAYLTRGYLPIKPGYEGEWTAVVKAPDGTVLATLPFTVQ
jgi:hypothetical protein